MCIWAPGDLKNNCLVSNYHSDPNILDRHVLANSVDPEEAVWSGSLLFAILSALFHCSNFRIITAIFFMRPNFFGVFLVKLSQFGWLILLLVTFLFCTTISPYLPSGLIHPYQLDKSISDFRSVRYTFILFLIEIHVIKQFCVLSHLGLYTVCLRLKWDTSSGRSRGGLVWGEWGLKHPNEIK